MILPANQKVTFKKKKKKILPANQTQVSSIDSITLLTHHPV